jgi:hypothetical protein
VGKKSWSSPGHHRKNELLRALERLGLNPTSHLPAPNVL